MSTTEGFKFDITNGQVTGIERVLGSHTISLRLPGDASFAVGAGTVTETRTDTHGTETIQFVQDAGDATLYHVGSDLIVVASPTTSYGTDLTFGYGFTIANGAVTAMQVTQGHGTHSTTRTIPAAPASSFALGADGHVTQTSVHDNVIETVTYVPSGTAGLYAVASDAATFVQTGGSATHLDVEAYDRARFSIDASGAVTQVQQVRADGSTRTLTPGADTSYKQLEAGYVLEVQTHGSRSSYELYHDGNGDGVYTEVAHGSGTTVDLVGIKAQISAVINTLV